MPEAEEIKRSEETQAEENSYGVTSEQLKEITEALDSGKKQAVQELLMPLHAADIADVIDMLSSEYRAMFVEILRKDFNPEILLELDSGVKEEIIGLLGAKKSAEAIIALEMDDAVDVMEDLAAENQQEILEALPEQQRADLEEGLAYPEGSAGRLLEKKIVSVPQFWTVGQTIDFLRKAEDLPKDFYQIFVVDPKLNPVGAVLVSQVMCSNRPTKMKDLMKTDLKLIRTDMDQEEVAFIFRQYGLVSAPVVNEEGRMVGVITVDDVVHVIEEEAQEDIMRMGGVSETDLHSGFSQTVKKRFPWLLINLITAVAASVVIAMFEGEIEKLAALAVLMPIVASMGGNAGTQTLTIAVRAISRKELTGANAVRVVTKEALVGIINGMMFAVIAVVAIFIWYDNLLLSLIFGAAMVATLLLAGLAGALIPLGLEKAGIDPAIASGVFLTTVTDVVAFGAFLGMAALILL